MVSAGRHSNPADVYKSPRKASNVTRLIFLRLLPAGHETSEEEKQNKTYL